MEMISVMINDNGSVYCYQLRPLLFHITAANVLRKADIVNCELKY